MDDTIEVTYTGVDPFLYGDRLVKTGDTLALSAAEVAAWGTQTPAAFQPGRAATAQEQKETP